MLHLYNSIYIAHQIPLDGRMTFLFFRAPPCRGEKKLGSGILPMPIVPVLRRSEVTTCFIHLYPEYPLVI